MKRLFTILAIFSILFADAQIKGIGYKFEGGPGTEVLFSRGRNNAFGYSGVSQNLDDSLYLTLGVLGGGKFSPIYHKNFSYGYYGKMARGWLVNNTSNYYYHGHEFAINVAGNHLTYRIHKGYEEFFRYAIVTESATRVTEDIGWTEFLNVRKTYIGYKRDFNENLSIKAEVVFKELEQDSSATGFNVMVEFQKVNRINLELYPSHPVWGYNFGSNVMPDLVKKSVFFNLSYVRWFSFEKSYLSVLKGK